MPRYESFLEQFNGNLPLQHLFANYLQPPQAETYNDALVRQARRDRLQDEQDARNELDAYFEDNPDASFDEAIPFLTKGAVAKGDYESAARMMTADKKKEKVSSTDMKSVLEIAKNYGPEMAADVARSLGVDIDLSKAEIKKKGKTMNVSGVGAVEIAEDGSYKVLVPAQKKEGKTAKLMVYHPDGRFKEIEKTSEAMQQAHDEGFSPKPRDPLDQAMAELMEGLPESEAEAKSRPDVSGPSFSQKVLRRLAGARGRTKVLPPGAKVVGNLPR